MKQKILILSLFISITAFSQKIDFAKFKGETVEVNQLFRLDKPSIYDYEANSKNGKDSIINKITQQNSTEQTIISKHKNIFLSEGNLNYIRLIFNISFFQKSGKIIIVNYRLFENGVLSNAKSMVIEQSRNEFKESNDIEFSSLKILIKTIKIDTFWDFYSPNNNPKYPEINKLKPLVKDADGVLNIYKLAEVIDKNKALLSKYLDE
jgi:hypothetical protein